MLKKAFLAVAVASAGMAFSGCDLDFGSGKGLAIVGGLAILGLLFGTLTRTSTTT